MNVIGIYDGHNASCCLLQNGALKYLAQEERFLNVKNYWGPPINALRELIASNGLSPRDIDAIGFSTKLMPQPHVQDPRDYVLNADRAVLDHPLRTWWRSILFNTPLYSLYRNLNYARQTPANQAVRRRFLADCGLMASKVGFYDHHLCHSEAAYRSLADSGKVLVLTLDGYGDHKSSTVSIGEAGILRPIASSPWGASLAEIYRTVTFLLGFMPLEHEYKLMGMAPYADPRKAEEFAEDFREFLQLDPANPLRFKRGHWRTSYLHCRINRMLRTARFDVVCAGLQKFTEDLAAGWVSECIRRTGVGRLILAGGFFMNVKANKRITELPEVESVRVLPSCGDESTSIGAAFCALRDQTRQEPSMISLGNIYLGTDISDEQVRSEIASQQKQHEFSATEHADIEKEIAQLLLSGDVVARCKGRMEFGARALGNRSILADPKNLRCISRINDMIKMRDFWMPFAPVIPAEYGDRYLINPKKLSSPHMMLSFDTTSAREDMIAATHQRDFTARPQLLEKDHNPDLHRLLLEFEKLSCRPVLLNTSFNLHGYPVVRTAADAFWVFWNSGLSCMALGNYMIRKTVK